MRYKQAFTLTERKLNSGKSVWYYRTYDEDGRRTTARSTGETAKGAARQYCERLLRSGELLPQHRGATFAEYADEWWIWDSCPYVKGKRNRGTINRAYVDSQRRNLEKHLVPRFGELRFGAITPGMIEAWMLDMADVGASGASVNRRFANLKIMLGEAERRNLTQSNPTKGIALYNEKPERPRILLTLDEVMMLFDSGHFSELWRSNLLLYSANLLAASTGVRLGAIQALHGRDVFPEYVKIQYAWDRTYGLKEVKTRDIREVPIPERTSEVLRELNTSAEGFVHSYDDGKTPINHRQITNAFEAALKGIGIEKVERQERRLSFHSWRAWYNTMLRNRGVPDSKIHAAIGHRTDEMTRRYTAYNREDMQEIRQVGDEIFGPLRRSLRAEIGPIMRLS